MLIDELSAFSEEEIDIAKIALRFSKQLDPNLDIDKYRRQIIRMSDCLSERLEGTEHPCVIIDIINRYIFCCKGFKYTNARDIFLLNEVLDKREGSCVGLSVLYLSLSERLHLPIYGVSAPEHLFIRYDDGRIKRNIEPESKGIERTDYQIAADLGLPHQTHAYYLRNLSKKEAIACFLNSLGSIYHGLKCYGKAEKICEAGLNFSPDYADLHSNLASVYIKRRKLNEAIDAANCAIKINPNFIWAYYNLGFAYKHKGSIEQAIKYFRQFICKTYNVPYNTMPDVSCERKKVEKIIQSLWR